MEIPDYLTCLLRNLDAGQEATVRTGMEQVTASKLGKEFNRAVYCYMFSSNCCFLNHIQVFQETGKVVRYFHLFMNFLQFVVIHTVKGFSIVNEAEVDVFLELSCFLHDPVNVGNLISGSSTFSKSSLNFRSSSVHILLKPRLKNFAHYLASMWKFYRTLL